MSKSDSIDRRRAAAYAWRFVAPDKDPEASGAAQLSDDVQEPDGDPSDMDDSALQNNGGKGDEEVSAEFQAQREEVFRTCEALADGIERVWQLTEGAAQAEAVTALLARATELGIGLCAMQHHPRQSVRLLRLAVRCHGRLSPEARENACAAAMWLDYSHPEVVDLLAEVALAGAMSLAQTLIMALHRWTRRIARIPDAGARLGRVLGQAQTVRERYIAMMWLRIAAGPEAILPLRHMLRQPYFSLRFRALSILNRSFPDAIEPEDVLFLLEDAVARLPPELHRSEENSRARYYFPGELMRAVVRIRPAGGHALLARIIDGDCASRLWGCELDDTWALCTLAAAYPDQALPHIDHMFRRVEWDRREKAVKAAGHLPDELAWPRLLAAAADGIPEVAEQAQQTWLERRGSLCPLDELAGLEVALLQAPPSDRMRSRLAVLRRGLLEARAAIVEVLLGEAPDPEALVLLLFAAADSGLWERKPRPGLPTSQTEFCEAIISGFGVRGVEGLCALAARYPEGRWGWLYSITELMKKPHQIPEEAFPVLQAVAARRLVETTESVEFEILSILAQVGAPPELFGRLWQVARDPVLESYVRSVAADALRTIRVSDADHDSIIVGEMESALAAADLPRFVRAATVGLRRELPRAVTMTEDVLEVYGAAAEDDVAVTDALHECVEELEQLARLPDGWLGAALARPGTQVFAVAVRRAWHTEPQPETTAALQAALASASASAAAGAAMALIRRRELKAEDPVIVDIAARAPLPLRAKLLATVIYEEVPLKSSWPLIEPILVSADLRVTKPLRHFIFGLARCGLEEELRAIGPRIVVPELRRSFYEWLPAQDEDGYWQDTAADVDDDDEA